MNDRTALERPGSRLDARIDSVDLLRGAVLVIMALDHARDFFGTSGWDPGFATASTATFLTRWVTHFCAPVFVFLAGMGAALSLAQGKSKPELARFLLTRGAWLALLDATVVSFAWDFRVGAPFVTDVLWAIGWSMIVLAGLVRLPLGWTAAFGALVVAGHNVLDGVHASDLGSAGWIWRVLHESGLIALPGGEQWFVGYPLVPWIGVMALGYVLGAVLMRTPALRRRRLVLLGLGALALFLVLRATNLYGDPVPWTRQSSALATVFSFVSCRKYPPSLLYLLMTLGPALLALAALDPARVKSTHPLLVFGRVPLFFYVVHLYVTHLAVAIAFYGRFGAAAFHVDPEAPPAGFGLSLAGVYLVWILVVVALYAPCRWFGAVKRRSRSVWLSYL